MFQLQSWDLQDVYRLLVDGVVPVKNVGLDPDHNQGG